MFSMIKRGCSRLGAVALSAVAAVALLAVAGAIQPASADDVPFWEQRDREAKAAKQASSGTKRKAKAVASANDDSDDAPKAVRKRAPRKVAAKAQPKSGKKLGGYAESTEPVRKKRGVRVAALGNSYVPDSEPKKSLSGGGVRWVASSGCLDGSLKAVVYQVAANYGSVTVNSTCRSRGHNRSVGGAPKSKHLSGDAVDFRVHGNVSAVYAYLRRSGSVGGLKHYGGGLFHIDNGERRSW